RGPVPVSGSVTVTAAVTETARVTGSDAPHRIMPGRSEVQTSLGVGSPIMVDAEEQEEQPKAPKKSSPARWLLWGLLGLAVLVGAAYATVEFVLPPLEPGSSPAKPGEGNEPEPTGELRLHQFRLPEILVNLDEGRLEHYLKTAIVLEIPVRDEEHLTELTETLLRRESEIRDCLIALFSGKDLEELRGGAEAKSRLKTEVKEALEGLISADSSPIIRRVLFDLFLVQ
ncbi:MAG: flagellar basal body-associated FliL family protein, partial [Planctomycetota bacterium]